VTRLNATRFLQVVSGKTIVIPPDGWHAHNFAVHGASMIKTLHRAAQITQRRSWPEIARISVKIFRKQLDKVIALVEKRHGTRRSLSGKIGFELTGGPSFVDVAFENNEALWLQALNEVFAETGNELSAELMPPIQSVMAQGYSKTNLLLGQTAAEDISVTVAKQSRGIAQKITKINQTTRNKFEEIITDGIGENLTVTEIARSLQEQLPAINQSRTLTIARTESMAAWNQGSVASFKESKTLTTLDVIGCQAREENSPQWKGESTCNATNIPIQEIDEFMAIGFHINHTGTLVASGFRNADGTDDS
jgi:hypothetical protein